MFLNCVKAIHKDTEPWLFSVFMDACMWKAKVTNTDLQVVSVCVSVVSSDGTVLLSENGSAAECTV